VAPLPVATVPQSRLNLVQLNTKATPIRPLKLARSGGSQRTLDTTQLAAYVMAAWTRIAINTAGFTIGQRP